MKIETLIKINKVFAFSNIMDNLFPNGDRCLICSRESAREYLCRMNPVMLSELHKIFITNRWMELSDTREDNRDFDYEYLLSMPDSNLVSR